MKTRLSIGILLAAMGGTALAGIYQRTRYTHVKVWNDQPTSFQEVTWSGGKDETGFATGYGTLTWYAPEKPPTTGSNIPNRRRMIVTASYSGTMTHGKFVGPTTSGSAEEASPSSSARKKSATSRLSTTTSPATKAPSPSVKEKAAPATTPASTAFPASSSTPVSSPTPSGSATAPPDSLNSLTRPPSSLNLNTPAETSPSPRPTPDESSSPSPL